MAQQHQQAHQIHDIPILGKVCKTARKKIRLQFLDVHSNILGFTLHRRHFPMASSPFLIDALVAQPAETAAWLERCLHDSCDAVACDVASAIAALKLARDLALKQCRASARSQAKLGAAAAEGCRNAAAALDAIASLCGSASLEAAITAALEEGRRGRTLHLNFQPVHCHRRLDVDVDADAGGLDFGQWVDIAALDGCQFVCAVNKDKNVPARGQRAFTVRVDVMAPDSTLVATLHLPPDAVAINIHGDDAATWTWTCTDSRIVVAYTAAPQAAEVAHTVHVYVLGTAVFTQRLVMDCAFACLCT